MGENKWLTSVIDPVLSLYSTYCISDSFTFADKVKTFNFPPSVFLCSYGVCSLFTNVPLAETIEICANALYDGDLTPPPFPRAVFAGADANGYFLRRIQFQQYNAPTD